MASVANIDLRNCQTVGDVFTVLSVVESLSVEDIKVLDRVIHNIGIQILQNVEKEDP